MLFQTLDDKKSCVAIYNGQNLTKTIPDGLTKTWSYSAYLKGLEIEYANLFCGGKTLHEICPEELKEDWKNINERLRAFHNSFKEAKISLRENCFFDLVPEKFLIEYCFYKNLICEHVFKTYEKPKNYDLLKNLSEIVTDIKYSDLSINLDNLSDEQKTEFIDKVKNKNNYINYDIFGAITGRLSVQKNSFPILNLAKSLRSAIQPTNDWFVELDMNGAELRTALGLLGLKQIESDLHEWNAKEIFNNQLNRTEAKNMVISWLYNSSSKTSQQYEDKLLKIYNKNALKSNFYKNGFVYTDFGRKIESDDFHSINYLIQSTLIDIFHTQVIKMNNKLLDKKSRIAFLIHDSVIIDLKEEEKEILKDLISTLSNTKYGIFPINVKIGNNFGNMKKMKLKV